MNKILIKGPGINLSDIGASNFLESFDQTIEPDYSLWSLNKEEEFFAIL